MHLPDYIRDGGSDHCAIRVLQRLRDHIGPLLSGKTGPAFHLPDQIRRVIFADHAFIKSLLPQTLPHAVLALRGKYDDASSLDDRFLRIGYVGKRAGGLIEIRVLRPPYTADNDIGRFFYLDA